MTTRPASQAEYDLPWVLESLDLIGRDPFGNVQNDHTTVLTDEQLDDDLSTLEYKNGYVVRGRDSVRYIADGKNLYRMKIEEPSPNNHAAEGTKKVTTACIGVCDPEIFDGILENEGFDAVLEYMDEDGMHRRAADYSPREGFVYPEYDEVPEVKPNDFDSNTQARNAKTRVQDEDY